MADTAKEKIFLAQLCTRDMDEYRRYAELAGRLRKHGRVLVNVDTLAEPTPYELPSGGSAWHQYLSHLPGLTKFFPHPALQPHLPMEHVERNRDLLAAQVAVLEELGLGASFSGPEPAFWPESFFRERPDLRGPRVDHPRRSTKEEFSPCTDLDEVQEMYRWMVAELRRNVPMLGSFGFRANDVGSGLCWCSALYSGMRGPAHCRDIDPGVRVARFVEVLHEGAEQGGGPVRVSFNGNFYNNEVYSIVPKLGENSFLAGWKSDTVGLYGIMASPMRGLLQPLGIIASTARFDDPSVGAFSVSFAPDYRRGMERFETAERVVDLIESSIESPARTLRERLDALHGLCEAWAGANQADGLFEAFLAFEEAVKLKNAAFPRGCANTCGVTMRHVTRPLVIRPELLTPEEESYFLPHVFNISQHEARMDYMDMHGGRREINPVLRTAAARLVGAARRFESVAGAPDQELVTQMAGSLRTWALMLRSTCNFAEAQKIRDRNSEALAGGERTPEKQGSREGDADYLPWNSILRDELDNTAELLALVEKTGGDLVMTAERADLEDMFVLGPDLAGALRTKMGIMRDHWRDVEKHIAPPLK